MPISYGGYEDNYDNWDYDDEYNGAFSTIEDDIYNKREPEEQIRETQENIQGNKIYDKDILQHFREKKYTKIEAFQKIYSNRSKIDKKLRNNVMGLRIDTVESILQKGFNYQAYKEFTKEEIMENLEKGILYAEKSNMYNEKEINSMVDIWLAIHQAL